MDETSATAEIWVLYVIGTLMIALRTFSRIRIVGWKGFHVDDYLVWGIWSGFTAAPFIAHAFIFTAEGRHTSLLTPEERAAVPVEQREWWAYGSKMFLLGLTGYVVILWSLKLNQLFFYRRIVQRLWVKKMILPAMGFLGVSFVAIVFTLTLTCIPYEKFWQVYPDPGPLCVPQNRVVFNVILVLNILTDLCIMLIPLPVVLSIRVGIVQKLGLWFLFSLGLFCMIAAILRYTLVFKSDQQGVSAMWSMREDFIAVFVGQAPMVYPLFKRSFWTKNFTNPSSYATGGRASSHRINDIELSTGSAKVWKGTGKKFNDPYSVTRIAESESQEEIIQDDCPGQSKSKHGYRNGASHDSAI